VLQALTVLFPRTIEGIPTCSLLRLPVRCAPG
jgi:hypothetical protein